MTENSHREDWDSPYTRMEWKFVKCPVFYLFKSAVFYARQYPLCYSVVMKLLKM